jgi:hypothetical protein
MTRAEGWYKDPYGLHDERWFSNGVPTRIVSDDGVESEDPPPERTYAGPLVPVGESNRPALVEPTGGTDAGQSRSAERGVRGAWEVFVETGGD